MGAIIALGLTVGLIFIFRLLGAWMFRINEIIKLLKEISNKLN
jgi:hypothetical protein